MTDFESPTGRSLDRFADRFAAERLNMVNTQLRQRGIRDERVLSAMAKVPRHEFIAEQYRPEAYEDHPIQIGEGQTISQPYIVARMLEALSLNLTDAILEVGTGSGYQTALLAELSRRVYSVERHAPLAEHAKAILHRLGYRNIEISIADGSRGWQEKAPFDAIVVSAAAPEIPKLLVAQMSESGRMILPVGPSQYQELQLVEKQDGRTRITHLEPCRFVPLLGEQGYEN